MKRFYLLGLLCCCTSILFAQQSTTYTGAVINEVTVVEIPQRDVTIITNVPTERSIDGQQIDMTDAGVYTMRCGEHKLVLRANGYWTKKKKLAIFPNARNEYSFKMHKKPIAPTQWQQFVMLDYTWGRTEAYNKTSQTSSLGVRYGWQKLVGWYVALNVSLQGGHYTPSSDYCLGETTSLSRNKLSLMGGVNVWLGCPLYFYMGIGYGYENVLMVSYDGYTRPYNPYSYFTNYNYPNNGVAWEFGLQGGYKGFTLRFGYALVGSSSNVFNELSLGLGYTFNLKK